MTAAHDHELWDIALRVERTQGRRARIFLAGQLDDHLTAGDRTGVDMWRAIADHYEQLVEAPDRLAS